MWPSLRRNGSITKDHFVTQLALTVLNMSTAPPAPCAAAEEVAAHSSAELSPEGLKPRIHVWCFAHDSMDMRSYAAAALSQQCFESTMCNKLTQGQALQGITTFLSLHMAACKSARATFSICVQRAVHSSHGNEGSFLRTHLHHIYQLYTTPSTEVQYAYSIHAIHKIIVAIAVT